MVPNGAVEADASKVDASPAPPLVTWNDAVGAWSGEKAIPTGKVPTGIGAPTCSTQL
jgi:hypothetical protein